MRCHGGSSDRSGPAEGLRLTLAATVLLLLSALAPAVVADRAFAGPVDCLISGVDDWCEEWVSTVARASSAAEAARAKGLSRVRHVRRAMATGTLADAVRGLAAARGGSMPPLPSIPPLHHGGVSGLGEAVGLLRRAVHEAEALTEDAVRNPDRVEALQSRMARLTRDFVLRIEGDRVLLGRSRHARLLEEARSIERRVAELVDQSTLYSATLLLVETIDRTLPALRGAAGPGRPGAPAEGCDVVDLHPALCIGGEGPNVYDQDYSLLIDLGGDDLYTNSAGGADPHSRRPESLALSVSVAIDLGGNDTYQAESPTASGARVMQGAGYIGGIGILVDAAGDDSYTVTSTKPWNGVDVQGAWGQGFGNAGGLGILADLDGEDSYSLTAESTAFFQGSRGMGHGELGGAGLLLDRGSDSDSFVAETNGNASEAQGELQGFPAQIYALGMGYSGTGILSDDGGADTMRALSTWSIPPTESRDFARGYLPSADAWGFGFGVIGGTGMMILGEGPTVYEAQARVEAPHTGFASIQGFGTANLGGLGALLDEGGSDVYRAESTVRARRTAVVDDRCECAGVEAVAHAQGSAAVRAHGQAELGGVGVLWDRSGDDRYESTATLSADAEARDERTAAGSEDVGSLAVADARGGTFNSSQAIAGFVPAAALLIDEEGDDLYWSAAHSQATARASAEAEGVPREASALTIGGVSYSQAVASCGGLAALWDGGGNDSYESTLTSEAWADPPTEVDAGEPGQSSVQASVQGCGEAPSAVALLQDGEETGSDSFMAYPEDPACFGERGEDVWRDCGSGLGVGVNR